MPWTLQNLTTHAAAVSFAEFGGGNLRIELKSQSVSRCSFSIPGAFDGPFLASFGDRILIALDGTPRFIGNVTAPRGRATAVGELLEYELSCPWWWLAERIVFRQYWNGRGNYPRVILGQNLTAESGPDWLRFTAGGQIREILDWAIACGAPFQYALPIPDGPEMPFTERVCITCAEAIKLCTRWMGSVNTAWDFTTTQPINGTALPMPTLRMIPRQPMTANRGTLLIPAAVVKTVTIGESRLQGIPHIAPAFAHQVPSVALYYETRNTSNAGSGTEISTEITLDIHPSAATGLEPGALVQAMELSGSQATYEKQQIVVKPWPSPSDSAGFSQFIWNSLPESQMLNQANIAYYGNTAYATVLPGRELDGVTVTNWGIADLQNELIQGGITPWMESAFSIKHGVVQFGLMIYYTGNVDSPDYAAALQLFGGAGPQFAKWIFAEKRCTNAVSQLYQYLTNYTSPETVPNGIAQALYNTLSQLDYTGTLQFLEQECSGDIGLDALVNIERGNPDWQSMNAPVQSVVCDIDRGATTIRLGLPDHLGFHDYVELLKNARWHAATRKHQERADNSGEAIPQHDATAATPHNAGYSPGAAIRAAQQNYALADASSNTVPMFKVLNGNHKDATGGGTWIPDNLNTPIPAGTNTLAYFKGTLDPSAFAMTALTIVAGTRVPPDDSTHFHQLIGNFSVSNGRVIPATPQGGVSGSQVYQYCNGALLGLQ